MPSAKENKLVCPFGCVASGRYPIAATSNGWKKHMTRTHGSWTDEQLNSAMGAGVVEAADVSGFPGFAEAAAAAPDSETSAGDTPAVTETPGAPLTAPKEGGAPGTAAAPRRPRKPINPKAIRRPLVSVIESFFAKQGDPLTDEEKKDVDDSIGEMLDAMGIGFEIRPFEFTLQSPFWALLFPLICIGTIFLKRQKPSEPESDRGSDSAKG